MKSSVFFVVVVSKAEATTMNNNIEIEKVKEKFNTGEDYLLSVCSLEPRKNIPLLLQAFSQVLTEDKFKHIKLVLVGRKAWGNNAINDRILELHLDENVIITDYVSDEDLLSLYNGAYCFVYPSLYEGFGLPILEAMACGIPVVTSNNSSIPEVAGDAAILINPSSALDIEKGIKTVLRDPKLRDEMVEKGYTRVKDFSWENIIGNMVKQYREQVQD